ncbi:MAG: hypothetical protein M1820_003355 [Bogoriella megaspora]|nr:MAG: hypothetical protein M1820_003355 [Bogoriella megaspora]
MAASSRVPSPLPPKTPNHDGDPPPIPGLTVPELQILKSACFAAQERAYCPYSRFHVGCAILTKPNNLNSNVTPQPSPPTIIEGANVENASYPVGTCAERVALGTAVASHGCRKGNFRAMAVVTDTPSMPIFMYSKSGEYEVMTVEQLLPMAFLPETLHSTTAATPNVETSNSLLVPFPSTPGR